MTKQSTKIKVNGTEISLFNLNLGEYISLTDIAKYRNVEDPVINNWMRNRSTIEFMGFWEKLYNPGFKPLEFERFKMEAGNNSFILL